MPHTDVIIQRYDKRENTESRALKAAGRFCASFSLKAPAGIVRDSRGKPFFNENGIFLSWSHSSDCLAIAVSHVPIGIDAQKHRRCNSAAIAKRFFHEDEAAFLSLNPEKFFEVWAAKESYVKYTGEGITSSFRSFAVADEKGMKEQVEGAYLFVLPSQPGYSLALTAKSETNITVSGEF